MMRTLIPLPKHLWDLPADQRLRIHNRQINDTLREAKHEALDHKWLRRWTAWMGHLAKLPDTRWATILANFKNVKWWRQQQQNPEGPRHSKTRATLSRLENTLVRYHPAHHNWIHSARDRTQWKKQSEIYNQRARGIVGTKTPTPPTNRAGTPQTTGLGHLPTTRKRNTPNTPNSEHPPSAKQAKSRNPPKTTPWAHGKNS